VLHWTLLRRRLLSLAQHLHERRLRVANHFRSTANHDGCSGYHDTCATDDDPAAGHYTGAHHDPGAHDNDHTRLSDDHIQYNHN
jgi:hypothetical protein